MGAKRRNHFVHLMISQAKSTWGDGVSGAFHGSRTACGPCSEGTNLVQGLFCSCAGYLATKHEAAIFYFYFYFYFCFFIFVFRCLMQANVQMGLLIPQT
jgi:hypothetical protein